MVKILFICKYNRFRSQTAEAYLKKINSKVKVSSAGVFEVDKPLSPEERIRNSFILDKFGLKLVRKSKGMKNSVLEKQDRIIVVADDIPKIVFDNPRWKDRVEIWPIQDEKGANTNNINRIVNEIIVRVDKLNKELKWQKQ